MNPQQATCTTDIEVHDAMVIATEPSTSIAVHDQCAQVEAWAEQCASIPELRDAGNKLAAIDQYLAKTSSEGRERVAATLRRLEVRIGKLLGPAVVGAHSSANEGAELTPNQRSEFRAMAEHEEVVEQVIAGSSNEALASRAKVTSAIKPKAARRGPIVDDAADLARRLRKDLRLVEALVADDRFSKSRPQIGRTLARFFNDVDAASLGTVLLLLSEAHAVDTEGHR